MAFAVGLILGLIFIYWMKQSGKNETSTKSSLDDLVWCQFYHLSYHESMDAMHPDKPFWWGEDENGDKYRPDENGKPILWNSETQEEMNDNSSDPSSELRPPSGSK